MGHGYFSRAHFWWILDRSTIQFLPRLSSIFTQYFFALTCLTSTTVSMIYIHFFSFKGKSDNMPDKQFDDTLAKLSKAILNDKVADLGRALGFGIADIDRYEKTNLRGQDVTSLGTLHMLQAWYEKTPRQTGKEKLRQALDKAGMLRLADDYLPA